MKFCFQFKPQTLQNDAVFSDDLAVLTDLWVET